MRVIIRQEFPLGRYHATPWRQSVFEERFGEWPPSPWRLLRALAARWFQYSRETDERDPAAIEQLLRSLGSSLPHFHLPAGVARGPAVRQYQPVGELAWSDPNAGSGAVKEAKRTLVPDQYRIVGTAPVFWLWEEVDLSPELLRLLRELLRRTLYFGRAESFCRLEPCEKWLEPNCVPSSDDNGAGIPVLAPIPGQDLRLDALLARSDQTPLENAPIPPGTAWVRYEYSEPDKRESRLPLVQAKFAPADYVQFAVGGHVFPPKERWIKVTERFRGRVLAKFEGSEERYRMLAGKDRTSSEIVSDHSHAYFILWPDEEDGYPTRLIVWRRAKPFDDTEIRALLESAQTRVFWEDSRRKPKDVERREDWAVRLVPLPMQTPLPHAFFGRAAVWRSATPFVPPWSRHRFRRNGKERKSESPEEICARLIEKIYGVRPDVEIEAEARWTKLHEPVSVRNQRRAESARTPLVRPGFFLRLRFAEPLQGPVIAGDSSHFGLGVFRREG